MIGSLRATTSAPTRIFSRTSFLSGRAFFVGEPGIEPGLPPPQGGGLPLSYSPIFFKSFLLHFVQIRIFFPDGSLNFCKFGFCLLFTVGLYFPLNFILLQTTFVPFLQTAHFFAMIFYVIIILCFKQYQFFIF